MDMVNARGRMRAAAAWVTQCLGSQGFFFAILGLFIFQALWFAFSDRYPMAFDESFHYGLIQLHATQWLPFFTHQPVHAEAYGAVSRDPSYLYHYLLSLPYRPLAAWIRSQTVLIIILRLINIGLFVWGLVLFRRLLRRLGGSNALTNTILWLFIFIPVVPFLAAQINYDNLLIPLMLWCLLATFEWLDRLKRHHIFAGPTLLLLCVLLLTCLVKYVFLPTMVILVCVMFWHLLRQRSSQRQLWHEFIGTFRQLNLVIRIGLITLFAVSCGLFAERYAVNLLRYHTPSPDCDAVLSVKECLQFGPWQRDYLFAHTLPKNFHPDYRTYISTWRYWMWRRLFFAIDYINENKHPLTLPGNTFAVLGVLGGALFLIFARVILRRQPYRRMLQAIIFVYIAALFAQTLQAYMYTGQPVAINGRYLIPFLPIIMLFVGLAFRELFKKIPSVKAFAAVVAIVLMIQGGGVLTFIFQSDSSWDWQNAVVIKVNDTARFLLRPLVYGSRRIDP